MASDFEDHCWKDVVEPKALDIYSHYERKTYVGDKPALLAIDLYKLAYQGGAKPVEELIGRYPSTCGTDRPPICLSRKCPVADISSNLSLLKCVPVIGAATTI